MDAPMGAATRERQHNVRTVLEYGIGRPKAQDEAGAQEQKDLPRMIFLYAPPRSPGKTRILS